MISGGWNVGTSWRERGVAAMARTKAVLSHVRPAREDLGPETRDCQPLSLSAWSWSPHGALVNVVRVPGAGGGQRPGLDGGDRGPGQTPGGQRL